MGRLNLILMLCVTEKALALVIAFVSAFISAIMTSVVDAVLNYQK
jgi:hypothetical protein